MYKIVFIFVALFYLLTLHGLPGNIYPDQQDKAQFSLSRPPFETSMERGRYAQVVSIGTNRTFNVDKYSAFLMPDLGWYSGHYYSAFPPGVAVLSVPLYLLGEAIGFNLLFAYATTAIAALLTGFVVYLIAKKLKLTDNAAIFSALVLCLASGFWSYSVSISAHPFSSLVISLMFLAVLHIKRGDGSYKLYALIWFLYSCNLFIDYPNLLIASPILLYALYKGITVKQKEERMGFRFSFRFIYTAFAMLFMLSLFVLYNMYHYQRPIAFTNQFNLKALEKLGVEFDSNKLDNSLFKKKKYSNRFQIARLPEGSFALTFSQDRGLFFYFPIFLIGIVGLVKGYRKHKNAFIVVSLTVCFNLILYSIFDDPWGGWSFGPRYLLPSLPLFAVMVGFGYEYFMNKAIYFKLIIVLLITVSVGVALLGPSASNAIPPEVEARSLGMSSNYFSSVKYMLEHGNSTFVYNQFLKTYISPEFYFVLLNGGVLLLFTAIFVLYKKNETKT